MMSTGTRDDQGISMDNYKKLNVKFAAWYDDRSHEGLFNRLKCTCIDLLDTATFSNNKEKRTIGLLNALNAAGKLSRNNLKLLHDTITITNQVGLRSELQNLLPSFPYAGVSSFTQHRQGVLKFFSNLSDTGVKKINERFNVPTKKYSDRWDMLFDLEKSRGVINKENWDTFIKDMKEIGVVETTPFEARTPADTPTQNPGPEGTPYETHIRAQSPDETTAHTSYQAARQVPAQGNKRRLTSTDSDSSEGTRL
ncbi:uncharacterized protein [Antedon mediterranea]|uniref:uncharacterized protein isoform X2 n=1 Tax=Antedon mediterranea TaxID=105859 RepID=UPI003AF643DE